MTAVIVEGKKDEEALRKIGFLGKIMTLKGRPLYKVVESVKENEVMILTDLDKEGKRLYSILSKGLRDRGIKIDNRLRELLFKTKLRQIEGIDTYLGFEDRSLIEKEAIRSIVISPKTLG